MSGIYVHNNPGNIPYNSHLLVFVRSWYMPENLEGPAYDDTWLRVASLKTIGPGGQAHYTASNANVTLVGMVVLTDDTGVVTKLSRTKPNKRISPDLLVAIKQEAMDIPSWEQTHNASWDYNGMVRKELVKARYTAKYGENSSPYFDVASSNTSYARLRTAVGPKPCNCGKKRR